MAIINDRVPEVLLMLGNRADLTARVIAWLGKAYIDIGFSYDFDELESDIDLVVAGGGNGQIAFPDDARAIEGVTAYTPSPVPLRPKDMKIIRTYPTTPTASSPGIYATHNTFIFLRPVPLLDTTVTIDFWAKPVLDDPVQNTTLLLPDDWLEILDYMAALRGHIALQERDKAQEIQSLLFGYTLQTTGKIVPGLIQTKLTRKQAQARNSEYGIAPRIA